MNWKDFMNRYTVGYSCKIFDHVWPNENTLHTIVMCFVQGKVVDHSTETVWLLTRVKVQGTTLFTFCYQVFKAVMWYSCIIKKKHYQTVNQSIIKTTVFSAVYYYTKNAWLMNSVIEHNFVYFVIGQFSMHKAWFVSYFAKLFVQLKTLLLWLRV